MNSVEIPSQRNWLGLFLKVVVTGGLGWFVLTQVNWQDFVQTLLTANIAFLALAFMVLVLQPLLLAFRWKLTLKLFEKEIPYRKLLLFTFESLFFNQTLPSSVGGDVAKVIRLHGAGVDATLSTSSVILDRIFGLGTLVLIAVVTVPIALTEVQKLNELTVEVPFSIIQIFTVLAVIFFAVALFALQSRFRQILKSFLLPFLAALRSFFRQWRETALPILVFSVVSHGFSILAIVCICLAFEFDGSVTSFAFLLPIVLVSMALPISIAGWGVREGTMVVLMALIGMSAETAIAISLLFGKIGRAHV